MLCAPFTTAVVEADQRIIDGLRYLLLYPAVLALPGRHFLLAFLDGKAVVYFSRANEVWIEHFAALTRSAGELVSVRWTADAHGYRTRDQGARLQLLLFS